MRPVRHARRPEFDEVRFEMAPLLDVVFILLTFFIFAMLVLARTDALDLSLPVLRSGARAEPADAIRVVLDAEGGVLIDGQAPGPEGWQSLVRARRDAAPDAPVRVFVDQRGDRRDLLTLMDELVALGVTDLSLIGSADDRPTGDDPALPR